MAGELKDEERISPCVICGKMRTKSAGGTIYTICDECWEKCHDKEGAGE